MIEKGSLWAELGTARTFEVVRADEAGQCVVVVGQDDPRRKEHLISTQNLERTCRYAGMTTREQ